MVCIQDASQCLAVNAKCIFVQKKTSKSSCATSLHNRWRCFWDAQKKCSIHRQIIKTLS